MLTALLVKIISGAYVGYATNDLAIQMLFRKRFGLGGIVLRTREEFIANISRLVERDIINHHTLSRELAENPGAFQESLAAAIKDLTARSLWNYLPETEPIKSVAGFEESLHKLTAALYELLCAENLQNALRRVIEKADVSPLFAADLMQAAESKLSAVLQNVQQQRPLFAATLSHADFQSFSFADIFSPAEHARIGKRLAAPLGSLHLAARRQSVETFFNVVENTLFSPPCLYGVAERLRSQSLSALLGEESGKALVRAFAERLLAVVESSEGKQVTENFARFVWDILEREQTTVFSLLSENPAERFDTFLRNYLPPVLQKLIEWLHARRRRLETLIDTTFRKNIKWKLQDIILQLFVGSVSQYADAVRRITDILDRHSRQPAETAASLTEQIIRFLKQNTVGQIVKQLRKNDNRLRSASDDESKAFSDPLAALLQKALIGLLQSPADSVLRLSALAERPIGDFISKQETAARLQELFRYLWQEQIKNRGLYAPRFGMRSEKKFHDFWINAYSRPWSMQISEILWNDLRHKADESLAAWLRGIITPENLSRLVHPFRTWLLKMLHGEKTAQRITAYAEKELRRLGELPWENAKIAFQSRSVALPVPVRQLLLQNLEFLLAGRIEAIVRNSLQKMPNEKLLDLVERFMGRELKPITLLGALLGGMAGGALAFLPTVNGYDDWLSWQATTIAAATYGITGYATNWLALRMIFRPYRPIEWKKGRALPFTPGVVAKNQARFAENMGKFVAGGLLNPQNIVATFAEKKEIIRKQAQDLVRQFDPIVFEAWLRENRAAVALALTEWAEQSLQTRPDALQRQLTAVFSEFRLEGLPWESIRREILEPLRSPDARQAWAKKLAQMLVQKLQTPLPLSELLGNGNITARASQIAAFAASQTEKLTVEDLRSFLLPAFGHAWKKLSQAPLGDYLGAEQREKLKKRLRQALEKQFSGEPLRNFLYRLIESRLAREFHPERTIGELFEGKLLATVHRNLDGILEGFINAGLRWLKDNKEMLAEKVYQEAYAQNKAGAFIYKNAIKDSVMELAEQGIPEFFRRESPELKELLGEWTNRLGETRLNAVGIRIDEVYLKQLTDTLLSKPEILRAAMHASDLLIDELMKIPVSVLAGVLQTDRAESLWQRIEPLVCIVWEELRRPLTESLPVLLPPLLQAAAETAEALYGNLSLALLTENLNGEQLQSRLAKLIEQYLARPAVGDWLQDAFDSFRQQIAEKRLGDVLPADLLSEKFAEILRGLVTLPESRLELLHFIEELLHTVLPRVTGCLAPQTIRALAHALINALLDTAEQYLPDLVGAVDIRKVVVREISEMDPQEIERLFYGFAAQYFRQLINYGFGFGIVFGLAIDLLLGAGFGLMQTLDWAK